MSDEKREIVKRVRDSSGDFWEAVNALRDYLEDKDSRPTQKWLIQFVSRIWCETEESEGIEVSNPKEFPVAAVKGYRAKSVEEIRQWAARQQAETVWYYRHKFMHEMFTAVVLAAKEVERASTELVTVAEGGAQ